MEAEIEAKYSQERIRQSRVTRRSLQTVLEQCQHALEQMQNADLEVAGDEGKGRVDKERLRMEANESDSSKNSMSDESDESDEV